MFRVLLSRQATNEVAEIVAWLTERSPQGAARWLDALEEAKSKLEDNPLSFPAAPESVVIGAEIRQLLFKTRRGRRYRALFIVTEHEVRVLHVRGPGQRPLGDR